MHDLGQTRSTRQPTHLLHTPDAFVRAPMPGMSAGSTAIVHASPALGAGFVQYTAELKAAAWRPEVTARQRFIYVIEGAVDVLVQGEPGTLSAGSYAYFPEGCETEFSAASFARLVVIEKKYEPLAGMFPPSGFVAHESGVPTQPLGGDETVMVRSLLPENESFDFAVNTMTYLPGAALSQVEVHVMEHGLLMLEGKGIYRLGDAWYPVQQGDFIWMAAYCPQWFGALGKVPAKYLIYKNWNRSPAL